MKKPLFKRVMTLMLAVLMSFSGMSFRATTVRADSSSTWEKVSDIAAAAASGKPVAITMTTSAGKVYALPNAKATSSGPLVYEVTKSNDILSIPGESAGYEWTITAEEGGYTIKHGTDYLYVTAANNGVRINSKPDVGYVWSITSDYLTAKDSNNATRYLGVYNAQDWRCYTSINNNIKNQTLEFWVLKDAGAPEEVLAELEKFTAAPENNSQVVIYYPADGLALTTTASGAKLAGKTANIENGKLNMTATMAYLTVSVSNGVYTFENDGMYLTSAESGSGLSFAADGTSDLAKWTLEQQADGTWHIMNVGAAFNGNHNQALEYFGGFTTYGVQNTAVYNFEFYGTHSGEDTPVTETYTVTVVQPTDGGGTIVVDKTEVEAGEDVVITVIPEEGYTLTSLLINNVEYADKVTNNSYTYKVTSDTVISGQFRIVHTATTYTVTVVQPTDGGGTIVVDKTEVEAGEDVVITVIPEEGYTLTSLLINNVEYADKVTNNSYTYKVTSDTVISGQFETCHITLGAPTVTTSKNYGNGILVEWDAVEGATGYVIYRRAWNTAIGDWTPFARWNNTTELSFLDTKVYVGTKYQYGIKAYYGDDPTTTTNLGPVGPMSTPLVYSKKPGKTTSTKAANTDNGISVTWSEVKGATGYIIYRRAWSSTTNGWTAFERWNNTKELSFLDTKVYAGSRYQYGIKAYYGDDPKNMTYVGDVGPLSTNVRITSRTITSISRGEDTITIKWSPSSVFTGYQLQYADNEVFKNPTTITIGNPSTTSKSIKILSDSDEYHFRVRSYHVFNGTTYYGAWSEKKNDGTAYAVWTSGDLVFTRSYNLYFNDSQGTLVDVYNRVYSGTIYGGFETLTRYEESGQFVPWSGKPIINVYVADGVIIKPISMDRWFSSCTSMSSFKADGFDTSLVTYMNSMFYDCQSLTDLDLKTFDTSKVISMEKMFASCSSLTALDLSSFNTSCVNGMYRMFYSCRSLTTLDLSSFDTSNVTSMAEMFKYCRKLESLNISSFDTSNTVYMDEIFYDCQSLRNLDLRGISTDSITNMALMFYNCKSLTTLDLSSFNTTCVTSMEGMFECCESLVNLDVSSFNTSNVTEMHRMFRLCSLLSTLSLANFDTGNVTNMHMMFAGCGSLECLDLDSFNTENVIYMSKMFSGCKSMDSLSIGTFNTHNVQSMEGMFYGCRSLTELDVSSFDTSNVTNMHNMFWGCESLLYLDLSSFNTTNVTDFQYMFYNCKQLTGIDLRYFDTRNSTAFYNMFSGCNSLLSLDLSSFDTCNAKNMHGMFSGCYSLKSLNISAFNTSKVTDMDYMFSGCMALNEIELGTGFTKWDSYSQFPGGIWVHEGIVKTSEELVAEYPSNASLWYGKWTRQQ